MANEYLTPLRFAVVAALPASSVSAKGDSVVLAGDGHLYTYDGSSWIDQGTQPVTVARDGQGAQLIALDQVESLKFLLTQVLVELRTANNLTIQLNKDGTDLDRLRANLFASIVGEDKC